MRGTGDGFMGGTRLSGRWVLRGLVLLVIPALLLSACGRSRSEEPPTATPLALPTATPTPVPTQAGGETQASPAQPTVTATTEPQVAYQAMDPLPPEQTAPPVSLRFAALDRTVPVTAMGWRIVELGGERTTQWDVPEESAGWHPNSVGPGGAGNLVISGHQLLGAAVFAPLAQGLVKVGQHVLVTDADGRTFVYQVTQVTEPLPITADLAEEAALATQFMGPTATPQLTLVTGWPDFTTTHRIIAVAQFLGIAE